MTHIQGIDGSMHQGEIDFKSTMLADMRFAFVKMTEGVGYTDPLFLKNWKKLIELDGTYIRGAYHFARPDSVGGQADGENEAKYAARVLKKSGYYDRGCLPLALDFEKYSNATPTQNKLWVSGFISVIEKEFGRKPIIYTGKNIWKYELGSTDLFVQCPLWQVFYAKRAIEPVKMPWQKWTFWQWSGGRGKTYDYRHWLKKYGAMPGIISGICDVNRFNGSLEDLRKMALLDVC